MSFIGSLTKEYGWNEVYKFYIVHFDSLHERRVITVRLDKYRLCFAKKMIGGKLKVSLNLKINGRIIWSGLLYQDCLYLTNSEFPEHLERKLNILKSNPIMLLSKLGRHYRKCCFCGIPLKGDVSLSCGYGPLCARNFGLPWNKRNKLLEKKARKAKLEAFMLFCRRMGVCVDISNIIISFC